MGRHLASYYGVFACLGSVFDPEADVTDLVRAHMQAQLGQVRALDLRERVQREIWLAVEGLVTDAHLPRRVANAIWGAFFDRAVTSRYLAASGRTGPPARRAIPPRPARPLR